MYLVTEHSKPLTNSHFHLQSRFPTCHATDPSRPGIRLPSLLSLMWGPTGTIISVGTFDHFRTACSTFWRTSPLILVFHNHTNSMVQNPAWEVQSIAASQEIPCILWNPKVHYRNHNSLSLALILRQINTVHALPKILSAQL